LFTGEEEFVGRRIGGELLRMGWPGVSYGVVLGHVGVPVDEAGETA